MGPLLQNLILTSGPMQKLFGVTPDVGRQMDRAQL